jgi:hypothetical protein
VLGEVFAGNVCLDGLGGGSVRGRGSRILHWKNFLGANGRVGSKVLEHHSECGDRL